MSSRPPVPHDPQMFRRKLDRTARGLLRDDIPNYWRENLHALSILARETVLEPAVFDSLADVNKRIIVTTVARVLDVLRAEYLRKAPPPHTKAWHFVSYPVLYVRTEGLWHEIEVLAQAPSVEGGYATHDAARALSDFLSISGANGELVSGAALEACLEHGRDFLTDFSTAGSLVPTLDLDNLDADHVHAYLCAFATAFHA